MNRAIKLIVEEVVVLVSSVFIFRSIWTLLDRVPAFSEDVALWIMLAAGLAAMVASLYLLNKKNDHEKNDNLTSSGTRS